MSNLWITFTVVGFVVVLIIIGFAVVDRAENCGPKYEPTVVTLENGDQWWEVKMGRFRKGLSLKDARDGSDTAVTFHDLRDRLAGESPVVSQVTVTSK